MEISFQLYSARNFTPWPDVIAQLAGLGYLRVEGFGGVYGDPAAFRALLDQHEIAMPSGHVFPLSAFEDGLDAVLDTAQVLGTQRLFCPAPDEAMRGGADAAAWIALAKRLETACQRVRDAGLRFGWHNHHWEFQPLPGGGCAMDVLLEHAPSMEWEIDVAWVQRGGADPMHWIAAHGDRISTAHLKDLAPAGENAGEDGWADLGQGVMDWPSLIQALRGAGVDLFVLEHDKPSDVARFATRSLAALQAM